MKIYRVNTFFNNINKINLSKINYYNPIHKYDYDSFELSKQSFTDGNKIINDNKCYNSINYEIAKNISKESKQEAIQLHKELKKSLKNYTATAKNPNNIICERGIIIRVKKPKSIMQKASCRNCQTKGDVEEKVNDIIGARIILKNTEQKNVDKILNEIGTLAKQGKFRIDSIENYRPERRLSYISQGALDNIENISRAKHDSIKIICESKSSGYSAVHINLTLHSGKHAEIQLIGYDIEKIKEIEDMFYKVKCNKDLPKEYATIEELIKTKISELDKNQKEELNRYIYASFMHARDIIPDDTIGKYKPEYFLQPPESLPEELGFANIYRLKTICDEKHKRIKN